MFYFLSVLGILLSAYTLYLHWKVSKESAYHAACDINNRLSCTATIKTKESKMFGIPNGVYGILFYLVFAGLYYFDLMNYLKITAVIGVIMSVYLGYQLYKIKIGCPVCISIYIINLILAFLVFY